MPRFLTAGGPLHLGLFIATTAPLSHISEGACDVSVEAMGFDVNAEVPWAPREAFEATFAGEPKFTLPPIGSGFNRTLNIDGFCNDILWKPDGFTSTTCLPLAPENKPGEFSAKADSKESGAVIHFDNANCPLSAISVRKTPGMEYEAEIRFQFEGCMATAGAAAAPVSNAAIVMGLRKITTRGANVYPWMNEVCNVKTTTPAASTVVVKDKANMLVIGEGTCLGTGGKKAIAGITTEIECRADCKLSIDLATATGKKEEACAGFAFRATPTPECQQYYGSVTSLEQVDATWICYNMTMEKQEYNKTQAPPSPINGLELTQNLHVREAMAGAPESMTTARLYEVTSDEGCFDKAWWFVLQDDDGNRASLPVLESEWDAMMAMIPEPNPKVKATKSTVTVDRVLVHTCNPNATGWGRGCIQPKVNEVCDNAQVVNAIVTGVVVPVLGWFLVWCFYSRLPGSCMLVQGSRDLKDADVHDEGNVPTCKIEGLIACCAFALIVCASLAFGVSAGISNVFGAQGCLHGEREMWVIGTGTGIPGALSFIIGLSYIRFSGVRHISSGPQPHYETPKGQKLMLVEVSDDRHPIRGVPLNPDILQTGNSALASYHSASFPREIQIDSTAQDLSAYQSMQGHGPMMSTVRPGGE